METFVSFYKEFEPDTTEADVIADTKLCGVTEDYAPQFEWADPREGDYDGYWYLHSSV
jgi:hypothetical protein